MFRRPPPDAVVVEGDDMLPAMVLILLARQSEIWVGVQVCEKEQEQRGWVRRFRDQKVLVVLF